jgi:beta-carotene 15,15'-dioxygenase
MTAVRWQGLAFCLACGLAIPTQYAMGRYEPQTELLAVAIIIVVLGVPHGALDSVFAEQLYKVRTVRDWALFGLAYAMPVAAVVAIWHWLPLVFLIGFLAISAVHFSGDPENGTPWLVRIFYGGAPVIFPALFHFAEVEALFRLLTELQTAAQVTDVLHLLAWPWLLGLVVTIAIQWKQDRFGALETAVVAAVTALMPPLVGFALFFCGMHSARHILRTAARFTTIPLSTLLRATIFPMVVTLVTAAVCWGLLRDATISEQIMQLLFVGLAAVTVPHMMLVDTARWARMRAPS